MEFLINNMGAKLPLDRKFLNVLWNQINKPSYKLLRPHKARTVEIDKQTFYQLFMNHIIKMRKKFPETNGRLCRYCEQPVTFIVGKERSYSERKNKTNYLEKKRDHINSNLSIDRLNPSVNYTYENIIFCCGGCNKRKNAVMPADVFNILRVYEEVETDAM